MVRGAISATRSLAALIALCTAIPAVAGTNADADTTAVSDVGSGMASWFGDEMAGRRTASGAPCNPDALTAAHRSLPLGSRVRVTNVDTGQAVVVTINDRGPYARGRLIDLSRAAADAIGLKARGHGTVALALLNN